MTALHLIPFIHIYSDSSMESPLMLKRLAEQFPSTPFVALDGFMTAKAELECMMLAEACPNVVFDTALVRGNSLMQLVAALGAERFLLGTDFYSGADRLASANTPWRIKSLIADEGDQQAILYGNLERLLRWAKVPMDGAPEVASKEA
jgi:predicted TIM-barrel fold metal-dependent hydrolase